MQGLGQLVSLLAGAESTVACSEQQVTWTDTQPAAALATPTDDSRRFSPLRMLASLRGSMGSRFPDTAEMTVVCSC